MTRDAGEISRVRSAADGAEDEHGVLNRTGHGAELIEGPAERHGPGARHTAEGGAQAGNTAAHGRTDDGAAGLAADGEADETCGGGGAWPRARTGGAFLEQPRIHGLAAEPDVIERKRAKRELRDQHCASGIQALHHGGICFRDPVTKGLRAIRGGNIGSVKQVLRAPRDAVKRTAVASYCNFAIRGASLFESVVLRERDDAAERGV